MDNNSQLPPSNMERAQAPLTESAELEAYFSELHERFATNADAPVYAALAEFVDVIDLTPVAPPAVTSPTTSRRPKMLTGLAAFVATTTGKVVLGATVAAASVGGIHAAEVVDVPLLPAHSQAEVLLVDGEEEASDSLEIDEVVVAPEEEAVEVDEEVDAPEDELAGEDDDSDSMDDNDDSDSDEDGEDPKNHGAVVSEFARTTELEGCEKGQAISALAKSKNKNADEDDDEVDKADSEDEGEESSKCKSSDDDSHDDSDSDDDARDDSDSDDDDDDDDSDGPPEGKGHNRDDHPGKGKGKNGDKGE